MHPRHLCNYFLLLVLVVLFCIECIVFSNREGNGWYDVTVETNAASSGIITFHEVDTDGAIPSQSIDHQSPHDNQLQRYGTKVQCKPGYTLSMSYYDQLTGAVTRMASLQCWASQHNMAVVEPFLPSNSTYPGMPAVGEVASECLRLGDLFNIPYWNNYTNEIKSMSFSPLVSWEDFLDYAPREVVAVQIIHRIRESYSFPCTYPRINTYWESTFEPHGFGLSRRVCIDLNKLGVLSEDDFNEFIFGNYSTDVTLLFDQWRGLSADVRSPAIQLNSVSELCGSTNLIAFNGLLPSTKCIYDAERYKRQHFRGQSFFTVMLRLEVVIQATSDMGLSCLGNLTETLRIISERKPIFLTTDIGAYGSQSLLERESERDYPTEYFFDYNRRIFEVLYGEKALQMMKENGQGFADICTSNHPAYVGNVQKVVASQGKCIFHLGKGHFRKHAAVWQGQRCVKKISCNMHPWLDVLNTKNLT